MTLGRTIESSSSSAPLQSIFLVILMLLSVQSTMIAEIGNLSAETDKRKGAQQDFNVNSTTGDVDITDTSLLSIPANHTFLNGTVRVQPTFQQYEMNSTSFGIATNTTWNGTFTQTAISNATDELQLELNKIHVNTTDFESLTNQPRGWLSSGQNHSIWEIFNPSTTSVTTTLPVPTSTTNGTYAVATTSFGTLSSNQYGCLQSPSISIPTMFQNYSIRFDSWTSLFDDDAAWVELKNGSIWQGIEPKAGYSNSTSNLNTAPSSAWAGSVNAWQQHDIILDSYLDQNYSEFQFRFCVETSSNNGERGGWFIDNVSLYNEGDVKGAWIHGNLSGDYAPNAYGIMYLEADMTNLTGNLELEFWANWDIEGATRDDLSVWYSDDNGSSWNIISTIPGLPGWGFMYQGSWYREESFGWIPIRYGLPTNLSSHPNASQILIAFQVNTE